MHSYKIELFEIEVIICLKMDLALNNRQRLICHKIQPTNQNIILIFNTANRLIGIEEFGLAFLFNGISILFDIKVILLEDQHADLLSIVGG